MFPSPRLRRSGFSGLCERRLERNPLLAAARSCSLGARCARLFGERARHSSAARSVHPIIQLTFARRTSTWIHAGSGCRYPPFPPSQLTVANGPSQTPVHHSRCHSEDCFVRSKRISGLVTIGYPKVFIMRKWTLQISFEGAGQFMRAGSSDSV